MMRVLYLCADPGIPLDGTKGASVHVRQTISGLRARGVAVSVAALRPPREPDPGLPVVAGRRKGGRPGRGAPVARELHTVAAAQRLAEDAAEAVREADVVYERYSLWSLGGVTLAERLGVPLVLEINAPLVVEQSRYRKLALSGVAAEIERAAVGAAAAVLCVSSPLAARARRIRGSESGVHLFPNAVDTALFRPRAGGEREERFTIAFAGSLKPWHGLMGLIDAFERLAPRVPEAELLIIGDGPERAALEARARELRLERRIRFTGALAHEEVAARLAGADAAVAPYPKMDDFYFSPLKIAEYLAAGLPVVATRLGDLAPVLEDAGAVVTVPPGDPAALASALARLAAEPALRARLARRGREVAERRLSLDAAMGRLVTLLEDLCRPRAAAAGATR